jgi:hypothetical protein
MPTEICHDRPHVNCEGANSTRFVAPIRVRPQTEHSRFSIARRLAPLIGATWKLGSSKSIPTLW